MPTHIWPALVVLFLVRSAMFAARLARRRRADREADGPAVADAEVVFPRRR